jgi:hypothetical protein
MVGLLSGSVFYLLAELLKQSLSLDKNVATR